MRYRSSVLWTLSGKISFLGSQFLLIMFLSKFSSMAVLGSYSLGLAISAPIFLFCNLQLRVMLATETNVIEKFYTYFSLRLLLALLAFPIVLLTALGMQLNDEILAIVVLCALNKFFDSISDIYYGVMQGSNRMDLIAKSQILRGITSVIAFCITYTLTENVYLALLTIAIMWLLVLIFFDYRNVLLLGITVSNNRLAISKLTQIFGKKKTSDESTHNSLLTLLIKGMPLGIVVMIGSLVANSPSYVIESKISIEAVGIFASLIYLMQSTSTFMSALWEPAIPKLANFRDSNNYKAFTNLILKLSGIGFLIGIMGTFIIYWKGELILTLLFNEQFAENVDVLLILSLVLVVRYFGGVWSVGATVLRYYWVQVPLNVVNLFLVLSSAIYLVDKYGMIGASYALLFSTVITRVVFLGIIFHGIKNLKSNFNSSKEVNF